MGSDAEGRIHFLTSPLKNNCKTHPDVIGIFFFKGGVSFFEAKHKTEFCKAIRMIFLGDFERAELCANSRTIVIIAAYGGD